jgi:hypothetical protein
MVVLAGLAAGILAVATTVEAGENRRAIAALPLVFAAAGMGASALVAGLSRGLASFPAVERAFGWSAPYAALTWLLVFSGGWNAQTYFRTIMPSEGIRFAYATELRAVTEYLETVEPRPYVYFYSDRWGWDYEARRFMAPQLEGEDRSRVFGEFILDRDLRKDKVVFVLMPEYSDSLDELKARYPHGREVPRWAGDALVFVAYEVEGPTPRQFIDEGAVQVPDGA